MTVPGNWRNGLLAVKSGGDTAFRQGEGRVAGKILSVPLCQEKIGGLQAQGYACGKVAEGYACNILTYPAYAKSETNS
ncbi:hypothetical protein BECAL_03003 [Bellilinea caldifistulae]|uniref:Uncharacterized protein n=1 Tax=Bellilinea caldifistulae TaxID=360411 RepID=A0A0P6XGY5_9CHLR|nr:hypothetical protein AC812_12425 [Bellilinea caldifistulae]GAP11809.1 hypothetical protein BECAL_03003 [Bellilinea caldifistulae]